MLILTRKVNDSIVIGSAVQVKVLRIGGGKVKLGLSAPLEISIQREELRQPNLAAAVRPAPVLNRGTP